FSPTSHRLALMATPLATTDAPPSAGSARPGQIEVVVLLLALVAMFLPTYMYLDEHVWSKEGQGHGPVMLALTIWLFYKRWPALIALPEKCAGGFAWPLLAISIPVFVLGQSQDLPEF